MVLREDSTKQKLRGAYYTPLRLAEKMVDFFRGDSSVRTILEPSCGDGVFIDALVKMDFIQKESAITAIEIEKNETDKLNKKLNKNLRVKVLNKDFLNFTMNIRINRDMI